ncbi:MAG: tRNA uridine-5-carboxymethylaminomethyl(34) synthesis GTPase MnmE, partial [Bacteroidales bacterium]|nr:tRNA uridine-5-carboxymethylaminomethyl(34) synthesis GTPase MnmE [Bacteroidales bacterium]
MNQNDTICAISTPAGVGGIAVVRLSGSDSKSLAESVLRSVSDKAVSLQDHKAHFARLYDGDALLDEVVALWFAAPHSYTGEDVVELSCHGSLYVQRRVLQIFIDKGARLAEPGEFTQRAFINGRLDLSQAEAVADLIDSRSQMSHALAV